MSLSDIVYTLGFISCIVLVQHVDNIQPYFTRLWDNIKNKTLNQLAIELFWKVTYAYTYVKYRFSKLQQTYPFSLVRSFLQILKKLFQPEEIKNTPKYPFASITQLSKSEDGKLSIDETTFDLTDFEWKYRSISENLARLKIIAQEILDNDVFAQECLVIISPSENVSIVRVVKHDTDISTREDLSKGANPSLLKFLMIDYVHPKMDDSIEITLDRRYVIEGNQILSGAFVGRLLPENIVFDTEYKTLLIDNESKIVEWNYSDFLEIGADKKYTVHMSKQDAPVLEPICVEDEETKSWDKLEKED